MTCILLGPSKNNQFNLSLVILSSQPMSTQSLAATPSGYLQHGSYPIVDLSPQHLVSEPTTIVFPSQEERHKGYLTSLFCVPLRLPIRQPDLGFHPVAMDGSMIGLQDNAPRRIWHPRALPSTNSGKDFVRRAKTTALWRLSYYSKSRSWTSII
jgi:hypothetical protein